MIILDTNVLSAAMSADMSIIAWLDRQSRRFSLDDGCHTT